MPNTYDNREIEWDSTQEEYGFWNTVDKGFQHAIICLTEVSKNKPGFIKQWSDAILQVLQNQDLEIYPIVNQNIFGQSEYNKMKISLEVNLLNGDVEQMAKTLIHEAFHIIGGCFKIENGNHVYDENLDTPNNSTNIPEMYQEMSQNSSNILNVRADTVAQYIMQAGSLLYVSN